MRSKGDVHLSLQFSNRGFQKGQMLQGMGNHLAVVLGNAPVQGGGQLRKFGAKLAFSQVGDHVRFEDLAIDNGLKHKATRNTKEVGDKTGEFDISILKYLVNAIAFGSLVAFEFLR